ncbi:Lysophospholipase 1 [Balamuthia mandrillaris]
MRCQRSALVLFVVVLAWWGSSFVVAHNSLLSQQQQHHEPSSYLAKGEADDDGTYLLEMVKRHWPHLPPHRQLGLSQILYLKHLYELQTPSPLFEPTHGKRAGEDCPFAPSPIEDPPASVHRLHPSDFRVVMAMGDSITAGFGAKAKTVFGILTEYRGVSWSIGGDSTLESVTTVPNLFRKYDPLVKGFSVGTGDVEDFDNSRLNVAITGSVAADLDGQVDLLLERLGEIQGLDIQKDWKLLTLFIGGNDLCASCEEPEDYSADKFEAHIKEVLLRLKNSVPRLFVNLVLALDVTNLYKASQGFCSLLHLYECPCGVSDDVSVREATSALSKEYNKRLEALVLIPELNDKEDFTVIIQPFLSNTTIPVKEDGEADTSYLAPDCFHFSEKAHRAAAVGLWNNMMEPVGKKRNSWVPGEDVVCVSDKAFVQTRSNTNL